MNRMNGTRFMTQEEFKERLTEINLEKEGCYPLGGIPLLVRDKKAYVDTSDSHTIIFGATGSKKIRLLGMPAVEILSNAGESFVITDPKGEIYDKTAQNVKQRGYQIYCLNLRDLKYGSTWNPLALPYDFYKQGEKRKAVEMINELAKMIIGDAGLGPFWSSSATDVLTGLMLILLESAQREECHIKSLIALWEEYLGDKEKTLSNIKNLYDRALIKRKLATLDNASYMTVGSIEAVASTGINRLMANEELVEFLSQEGMEFDSVTKKKTAIYLIIPDENTFYHFIASLFLAQIYEVLIKDAQSQPEHKLAIRMHYIVDEFANIPKIENMDSMITAARSRNIRFHLIVQSKMQLKDKYGDMSSVICDNCNNWVYLYSKDYELLNEISNLCGKVIYDNQMTMPLISEFELQHLSKDEGEALVLAGRNYPCIVNLTDIDEYPAQKRRYIQELCTGEDNEQMTIVPTTWNSVCVFNLNNYAMERKIGIRKEAYRFPVKRLLSGRKRRSGNRSDVWLVGTYNSMILAEDIVSEEDIEMGEGILRISFRQFGKLEDTMELQWYMAPEHIENMYMEEVFMENYWKVFMTIQEIGIENFVPVAKKIPECLKGRRKHLDLQIRNMQSSMVLIPIRCFKILIK